MRSSDGIATLYTEWTAAFARGDVDAIVDLLTPEYTLWAPGRPALDRTTLRPALAAAFAAYEIRPSFQLEERIVSADLAFDRGVDVQELVPKGGGEPKSQRQQVFLVLQRGADGRWRFRSGIALGALDAAAS